MCGISLIAQQRTPADAGLSEESGLTSWALDSVELQAHRGPDSSAVITIPVDNFTIGLGHCRLSVIDLDPRSQQPMWSPDNSVCLSYNGELYNYLELRDELRALGYSFDTESDTEVVLRSWQHWGAECLEKFDGMFAFVVVDTLSSKIFGARDALGVKPFYWRFTGGILTISSEIWSLLDGESQVNIQTVVNYVAGSYYDVGDETFVEGVRRLEGGHALEFDLRGDGPPRTWDWWDPDFSKARAVSEKDALIEVREAVLGSISGQLMSDVPLGFALSGGLDSSVLVCGARFVAPESDIRTITYSPGKDSGWDESPWAKKVSDFVDADATVVTFDAIDLAREIYAMTRSQGEPFSSARIFAQYKVFQAFNDQGITVAIEGQGGDELFAGYDGFPHLRVLSLLERGKFVTALKYVYEWLKFPKHRLSRFLFQFGSLLAPRRGVPQRIIYSLKAIVLGESVGRVFNWSAIKKEGVFLRAMWSADRRKAYKGRRLVEGLLLSLRRTYIPQLVRQGDRNAMAWSIENRVPFLSYQLVQTVLSLPEDYLVGPDAFPKSLLRRSMKNIVPEEVLTRRDKVGFAAPQSSLVDLEGFDGARLTESLASLGVFDAGFLERFFSTSAVFPDENYTMWRVLNLAVWVDVFRDFCATRKPVGA